MTDQASTNHADYANRSTCATLVGMGDHPTNQPGDHPTTPGRATSHAADQVRPVDWSGLTGRLHRFSESTTDRALQLVAEYAARPAPTNQEPTNQPTKGGWLRYVPPVAALGTAFVLQTIVITDTLGTVLADRYGATNYRAAWFGLAALFGLAVASCVEGSAAYLLDLYDKHLLARDSVWVLRLAMVGYVGASAYLIHWWTTQRHLPEVVSWALAAMAGSALFLWTRGSRWRHREAMRAAGQIDPAMPRLPMPAKLLHPIRWLITLYLVSWEPVASPAEARARYEAWRSGPHWWSGEPEMALVDQPAEATTPTNQPPAAPVVVEESTNQAAGPVADQSDTPTTEATTDQERAPAEPTDRQATRPARRRTDRPKATTGAANRPTGLRVVGPPAVVANARRLRELYPTGLPDSVQQIRKRTGWSKDRADRAVAAYHAGADQAGDSDNEQEQSA